MKRFLAIALIATVGLIYSAGSASAAGTGTAGIAMGADQISGYADGLSANGVGRSGHNLGIFGMHVLSGWDVDGGEDTMIPNANATAGTSEICVFCHTPHHTRGTSIGPLWNRGSGTTNFTVYAGTIGDDNPNSTPGSYDPGAASVACLSCHDGVTKFDMLVNAPGDGGVVFNTAGASQGWTFREKLGSVFGDDSRLTIGADITGAAGGDLSNDHPIGMVYKEGEVASLRDRSTNIAGINLIENSLLMNRESFTGGAAGFDNSNLSQNKWAVFGFINTAATIQNLLKGSGAAATVECGSCHDPHFSNRSWGENLGSTINLNDEWMHDNGLFLRRVGGNAGSGVCRTCHDK